MFQKIIGRVELVAELDRTEVGSVTAYLMNLTKMGGLTYDTYDCVDGQLEEIYATVFDLEEGGIRDEVLELIPTDGLVEFHLHAHDLRIKPEFRGRGYGLATLNALRLFTRRPYMLVTAKAYPTENERGSKPSAQAIQDLSSYYQSDDSLGFVPFGDPKEGFLVSAWE
jgi:GNAT superfamily N-acetyltransferase